MSKQTIHLCDFCGDDMPDNSKRTLFLYDICPTCDVKAREFVIDCVGRRNSLDAALETTDYNGFPIRSVNLWSELCHHRGTIDRARCDHPVTVEIYGAMWCNEKTCPIRTRR